MDFSDRQLHVSATGAHLALRHQAAEGDTIAAVHILHGLADHSERFSRFARHLARAGFHAYSHDMRGHGYTEAQGAPLGSFDHGGNGVDLLIADIDSVHDRIADTHPGLPVILFGHSMGGTIALTYAFRHTDRLAGCAAWNASLTGGLAGRAAKAVLAWERFRRGSDAASFFMPRLTFGRWAFSVKNRRTEFDWLSRDPAVVDAYIADPLCGWPASVGMWSDIVDMVFEITNPEDAAAEARTLPFHLLGGRRDPATEFGNSVERQATRMRRSGFTDVTLELLPEMRHETLNEIGNETAIADLIRWFRTKAGA